MRRHPQDFKAEVTTTSVQEIEVPEVTVARLAQNLLYKILHENLEYEQYFNTNPSLKGDWKLQKNVDYQITVVRDMTPDEKAMHRVMDLLNEMYEHA